eukprot:295408-Chlamydomonas_euryale.AAC.3
MQLPQQRCRCVRWGRLVEARGRTLPPLSLPGSVNRASRNIEEAVPMPPPPAFSVPSLRLLAARFQNIVSGARCNRRGHPDASPPSLVPSSQRASGNVDEAVPLCRRVVSRCEAQLPPGHADFVAASTELALALAAAGDFDGAADAAHSAMAAGERSLGVDDAAVLAAATVLAQLLHAQVWGTFCCWRWGLG